MCVYDGVEGFSEETAVLKPKVFVCVCVCVCASFFLQFLGPLTRHMEVPKLGV